MEMSKRYFLTEKQYKESLLNLGNSISKLELCLRAGLNKKSELNLERVFEFIEKVHEYRKIKEDYYSQKNLFSNSNVQLNKEFDYLIRKERDFVNWSYYFKMLKLYNTFKDSFEKELNWDVTQEMHIVEANYFDKDLDSDF